VADARARRDRRPGTCSWYNGRQRTPFAPRPAHAAGLVHPLPAERGAGVAEVASVGGHVQQYQIDIDPNRLRAYNLSLGSVVEAVRNSNENVGGNVLEANGTWSIVRGVGLVESIADLENIVVAAPGGVPVYVRQVARVHVGDAFRVASLVKGRDEAVGGVIVMRSGSNAQQVIDAVKERIGQIAPGLPRA